MSVSEATSMFKVFAEKAFKTRWGADVPIFGRVVQLKYHSRYESRGLEEVLQKCFGQELLFGGRRELQSPSRCKVAVTTTDTNKEARLLSNYNRMSLHETPYQFQRFEKPHQELKAWEAARATTAAPGYFRSFYHPSNGHTYQDGALRLNNPILAADYERRIIWPECAHILPDVLVSISTGYFPNAKPHTDGPGPRINIGLLDGVKAFVQIGRDAIESDLDCERTWDDFVQCTVPAGSAKGDHLHRLTLPVAGPRIELDAVDKMSELEELTKNYYSVNAGFIEKIACQLVASLFYFELASRVAMTVTGTFKKQTHYRGKWRRLTSSRIGMIRCRLPQDITRDASLKKLARSLRHMNYKGSPSE